MYIADEAQMGYTLPLQGSLEEKISKKWYPKANMGRSKAGGSVVECVSPVEWTSDQALCCEHQIAYCL